jgi:nucleotide-binding universal stress UspA family protein
VTTVRITGNARNPNREEWVGAPTVDQQGHIDRSVALPEEAFLAMERGIRRGGIEGVVQLSNGSHLNWFVDRPWGTSATVKTPKKPVPHAPGLFHNILVPVDLTDRHERALEVAAGLVAQTGGEVTLLHVIERIDGLPREEAVDFYKQLEEKAEVHLGRLLGILRQRSVAGRVLIVHGNCVQEIADFANRANCDLIILASHAVGRADSLGGWATKSYQIGIVAQCPVMLLK